MLASDGATPEFKPVLWDRVKGFGSRQTLDGVAFRDHDASFVVLDWAPDGSRVAGVLVTKTGTVVAVAWHEGTLRRVLDGLGSSWDVSWLPDSRRLLVAVDARTLLIFDTATGTKKTLTLPAGYNIGRDSIALSPDGKAVYFGDQRTEADVWMVERR